MTSAAVRTEYTSRIGQAEDVRARWRSIAMSGTTPDPPPTSSTGAGSLPRQTKYEANGPRSSIWSPTSTTSWKYGDTSPSARQSIVSSISPASHGDEAIEYERCAL